MRFVQKVCNLEVQFHTSEHIRNQVNMRWNRVSHIAPDNTSRGMPISPSRSRTSQRSAYQGARLHQGHPSICQSTTGPLLQYCFILPIMKRPTPTILSCLHNSKRGKPRPGFTQCIVGIPKPVFPTHANANANAGVGSGPGTTLQGMQVPCFSDMGAFQSRRRVNIIDYRFCTCM
jgi:hypothetical protein